jgi:hypothetical protein
VSAHLRRVIAVRIVVAALTAALPPAWVIGRIRRAFSRARPVPGLPADGEPLDAGEMRAFIAICRGWKHTARTERSRT